MQLPADSIDFFFNFGRDILRQPSKLNRIKYFRWFRRCTFARNQCIYYSERFDRVKNHLQSHFFVQLRITMRRRACHFIHFFSICTQLIATHSKFICLSKNRNADNEIECTKMYWAKLFIAGCETASRAATQIVDWIVSHINMYSVCASIGRRIFFAGKASHIQHIYNSIMLACRAIPFRMRLPRNDFVFVAHFDGCAWIDLKCFSHHRRSIERAQKNGCTPPAHCCGILNFR